MSLQDSAHCKKCDLKDRPCLDSSEQDSPDILFVGGYPTQTDINKGPFTSKNSALLRRVLGKMQRDRPRDQQIVPDFSYACLCSPEFDEETRKYKINADIVNHCSLNLKTKIDRIRPSVIVAMGADALRALEFKGRPRDMRGGIYSFKRNDDVVVPVVATFHVVEVSKSPGLLMTFIKDLEKAFALAKGGLEEVDMDIRTPMTLEAILSELEAILRLAEETRARDGKSLGLAVDTETTSLTPYVKDDRVIAISMSAEHGRGLAYPWKHRDVPFTDAEFEQIRQKTAEVLSHPSVSILMANAKFDIQWLEGNCGLPLNPVAYDVILAEHILDEDKKGEYSLKDLTRDRFPAMGKYEEELKEHLNSVWNAKQEQIHQLTVKHKDACAQVMIDWWVTLDGNRRLDFLSEWIARGYLALSETEGLHEIRLRKLHGEMVIPKKYQAAVTRMISKVPLEVLPEEVVLPELNIPAELEARSFEDAEVGLLLRYAAIDAVTTRMICRDQNRDFRKEAERIQRTEQALGQKLPTVPCKRVMNDNTLPLCRCIAHMEYHGVRLDRERAKEYQRIIQEKIEEARDGMFTEVGRKFNPSSSAPDLGNILYQEYNLPVKKTTDTGAPSTDADTIKELADEFKLPFLDKLLAYRKLDKCLHTYIDNWLKMSQYDGKIHAQFNQIGTATYRLSSNSPNLQNTPFAIKEANLNLKALFIPDSTEYDIYDLDISNAEMRVLTAYSRDAALTNAFNNGQDLHCLTAAGISDYSYDDIKANKEDKTTDQYQKRQLAKKINFGTIYCMAADTLKKQLWSELKIDETVEQCQEYLNKFFETYPGVKSYIDYTKAFVERFGYTWTFTGRRRRFAIASFSSAQMSRMGRQAVNARIQTTSSDLVTYNLIDLQNWLLSVGGRMLLTVHDSMLFQLPKGATGVKAVLDNIIMEKTAERAPWLPVQWKYDVGKGPNYGDTHEEVT